MANLKLSTESIKQIATPGNPASGFNKLYFKSDDKLYKLTSGGTEEEVGAGGGDVVGPASSIADRIATYSDTSGKVIKDSGVSAVSNADGFIVKGGTTERDLTVSGGDVAIVGGGTGTVTFPNGPCTLATTAEVAEKVTGPASSTDNAITRYDGTTGKLVQNSSASIDDNGTISANTIKLSASPTLGAEVIGELYMNTAEGGLPQIKVSASSSLTIGSEMYAQVVNKTGSTLLDGKVVYISGAQGNRPTATLARADSLSTCRVIGVCTADILNDAEGFVTIIGEVHGYNTSGFTTGDTLYLSATNAGELTKTAPSSPNYLVEVARALNSTNNGLISVSPKTPLAQNTSLGTDDIAPTQASVKSYVDTAIGTTVLKSLYDAQTILAATTDNTPAALTVGEQTVVGRVTGGNVSTIAIDSDLTTVSANDDTVPSAKATKIYSDRNWIDINRYGFLNLTETQITFDGTNLFTLAPTGTTWSYFRAGLKHTITGSKTVTLPGSPVATGKYYIYIDATDGTLSQSTSQWTLNDTKVPVSTIYFDNTMTPKFIMSNERHQCLIDRRMHMLEHYTVGTIYSSGGALSGYTLNTPTDAGNTFGIDATNIFDEDLYLTLSALADTNGTTPNYRIVYRTGASTWSWIDNAMPFLFSGGVAPYGYIQYDNGGTMTAAVNNRFVNYYVVMTNTITSGEATQGTSTCPCRYSIVPGRTLYSSATTAYTEDFSTFSFAGFPVDEGVAVWQITFDTSGVANTVKGRCQINRVQKISRNIVSSTTSSVANHDSLAGLNLAQSTVTWGHINDQAQTIAGAKTFTDGVVANVTGNVSGSSGSCTGNAATATNVALGGITGLGTGVATALAINVGSSGAFATGTGTANGTNTGDQNLFSTIAVSGQDNVVADSTSDTLTLAAGSGITITTNASSDTVTISNSGGSGITWNEVTGTSQTAAVDNGYIANNASLVTVTLPSTAAVGKTVRVAGSGAGGWKIAQNASGQIKFGNQATTVGATGYVSSTNQYDAIELVCITANNIWMVASSVGNITIA